MSAMRDQMGQLEMHRHAVFTGVGCVEIQSLPEQALDPASIAVRPLYCGVCSFERAIYSGTLQIYPSAPGHEVVGVVEEIGPAVETALQVGDSVLVDLLTRCGTCSACRRGQSAVCKAEQGRLLGGGVIWMGGGYSDRAVVAPHQLYIIRSSDLEVAVLGEPIACVSNSIRRSGVLPADRVLIIGAGLMGRLHAVVLEQRKFSSISVTDIDQGRREQVEGSGTVTLLPERVKPDSADVVFVTYGSQSAFDVAFRACDFGGTVVLFGVPSHGGDQGALVHINPAELHRGQMSLISAYSHESSDWEAAVQLLEDRSFSEKLKVLVTRRVPLEDIASALSLAIAGKVLKVVVEIK
jgi:L-iditol 2-dehydrogenase